MASKPKVVAPQATQIIQPCDPRFLHVADAAMASMKATKCWASVTLSQWAQESGYGAHIPPDSNNFFGIKAVGDVPFVECQTTEYIHGQPVQVMAKFRKFDSVKQCFDYHALLLVSPHGPYAAALPFIGDACKWVSKIGFIYATDPSYASKILALMHNNNLQQFDKR